MKECAACGRAPSAEFIAVERLPQTLFPVSAADRYEIPRKDIVSYLCGSCGHVFTDPLSAEDAAVIYETLYEYYPYGDLESMNEHYRKPFEEFFSSLAGGFPEPRAKSRKLLEVGCSSEANLGFFEQMGLDAVGIDPGAPDGENPKLVRGFYEDHAFGHRFDVVVSRFVLEHANSAETFLRKNHADLDAGGVAIVQVPNVTKFVKEFVPLFLAHEHVHYFNPTSLQRVAERAGFEVQGLIGGDSPSLLAGLRKRAREESGSTIAEAARTTDYQSALDEYLASRERVGGDVKEFLASRSDVCFHGAGLCLAWLLYDLGLATEPGSGSVVDDNRLVQGLFMPHSDLEIFGFEGFDWRNCGTVLLTLNPIYHGRVVGRLLEGGYVGEVYAIGPNGLVRLSG